MTSPPAPTAVDVVIVGGGVAGSALATVLARQGSGVLLLERDTAYRDRGYGEYLQPWGVAELIAAGLMDCFQRPSAVVGTEFVRFESDTLCASTALDQVRPGVAGSLQLSHPQVCANLLGAARGAGARVERGVRILAVRPGRPATIDFAVAGRLFSVRTRLLVGADGRHSVVRRCIGATLTTSATGVQCDSMLLGDSEWPAHRNAAGNHPGQHVMLVGRGSRRVRVYRFRGVRAGGTARERQTRLLDDLGRTTGPWGADLTRARPDGPCVSYPMSDARSSAIIAPGVVLIGDAAGWSNPLIGQGLSVAFADVRRVAERLRSDRRRRPTAFAHHADERRRLMERLRLSALISTELMCDFSAAGPERRRSYADQARREPLLDEPLTSFVTGPLRAEPEAFDPANVRRIRAALNVTRQLPATHLAR